MKDLLLRLLPKTLSARIFGMFGFTMLAFLLAGLGTAYHMQFVRHIDDTQDSATMLLEVAAQAVEESAVIGDYDTVKRTLAKMLIRSPFKSASFIDMSGGRIELQAKTEHEAVAPRWMTNSISEQLFDLNRPINVGGKDYGVMRLSFDEAGIADQLWQLILRATMLAAAGLFLSLVAMRILLKRWLGHLGRLQVYEAALVAGDMNGESSAPSDAPVEVQEAIRTIARTAASMRSHFGQRIDSLVHSLMQHKNAMDEACIVCELDADGRLLYVNDKFMQCVGRSRDELLTLRLDEVGTPDGQQRWVWKPQGSVWQGEVVLVDRNANPHWHRRTIVPIFGASSGIEKYICIDVDITERKQFENAILASARRQRLIAALWQQALEATDPAALFAQAALLAAEGLDADFSALLMCTVGDSLVEFKAGSGWRSGTIGGISPPAHRISDHRALDALLLPAHVSHEHLIHSGTEVGIVVEGRLVGFLGVYAQEKCAYQNEDIIFLQSLANGLATAIERHEAKRRLTHMAQHDALTDLPNRRRLVDDLETAIARCGSHGRLAVMFIDLDRFKNVNDTMGHSARDEILVVASRRIERCLRERDVVARLGGDEFAIILEGVGSPTAASRVADKVISTLCDPFDLNGQQVFLSASVGIAVYPDDGGTGAELIRNADTAMYSAKAGGRNGYRLYAAEMNEQASRLMHLETSLRGALERNEFVLHYQPKVKLSTGSISGFEALLRWKPEGKPLVSPLDFIPILEETGLISEVGEWVIHEVCRQIRQWEAMGLEVKPVAINLSARQFQQKDLAQTVGQLIAETGVDPRMLEFELTESMLMQDAEQAVQTLLQIKCHGVRLSVDDFGTGYSSLAYLKRFPIDALKIDRAFIRDLPNDLEDAAITLAVIGLAHALNLKVIAEGVETDEQLRMLIDNGCDEIQGYHFSRPLEIPECTEMIRADSLRSSADSEHPCFKRLARI